MANKQKYRPSIGLGGIALRVSLVLACLMMLSVHMMGGLFAKYSSSATGSDSARVAKFDIQLIGPEASAIAISDTGTENGVYQFTLKNDSEVAVSYELSVAAAEKPSEVTATFSHQTGELAPGAQQQITLTFTVDWSQITGTAYAQSFDFTVTAHVEQLD